MSHPFSPQKPKWQRALISQEVAQAELRGRKVWVKALPPQDVEVGVLGHPRHVVNPDQRHYLTNLRSGLARIWLNAIDAELLNEFADDVPSEDIAFFALKH